MRKSVQRSDWFTACQLGITVACLTHQILARLQSHNRIDRRIQTINLVKIGCHHLRTGNRAVTDALLKTDGVHRDNV